MLHLIIITLLAIFIAKTPVIAELGLGSLPLAILLGMLFGASSRMIRRGETESAPSKSSLFCQQKLLRLGIILLGFSLTFQQVAQLGWQALVIDIIVICTVLLTGITVGIKVLKMDKELAVLTSVGSAVCGAAAIMATEPVVKGGHRQVSVAVATVVLFGTLSLIAYPLLFNLLPIAPEQFGIFIGSTVHEVAQAVAAGQTISPEALQTAIMTKLIRVMCLAPVVVALSLLLFREKNDPEATHQRIPIAFPHFIGFFILAVVVNSLWALPETLHEGLTFISQFSLTIAMAAMGFNTRWSTLRQAGLKPIILAAILFIVLFSVGLGLNLLLYP
ncbi:YeiH family protein [Oceanospirillum maris]|uniref:YeiH family protein n=1 Tax=Oceanospirillum maris TaxID=64977 RepID=UPI0003F5007F|nr:YeiH family protein [Oceanospirillum maris]